jgi:hypothetical protein
MAVRSRSFLLVIAGFAAGMVVSTAGFVFASTNGPSTHSSGHAYLVSIDEIKSNLVPGEVFSGEFDRRVTMSDGSVREVTLRSVTQDGEEWVELIDKSGKGMHHSYMGPNGTTTDGTLMISVKDVAQLQGAMKKR